MNKGQFKQALAMFTDDIEICVLDSQGMTLSIKHIDYIFNDDKTAYIELVPMGSHQQNPKAVQFNVD
jgi:hypothetical protein